MDMQEEYILRWNDHGVSFFALAEDLLQQELLTDVTIWCGDRVFDAHRLVLCACSPLFRAMLTRQPPRLRRSDSQPVVFLKDVSPVHFERLLQFMYCGEVRVPNNELEDLLATATSLNVRGLADRNRLEAGPPQQQQLPPVQQQPQNYALSRSRTTEPPSAGNKPAPPPKKRRLSRDEGMNHHAPRKSPLSTLDSNRLLSPANSVVHSGLITESSIRDSSIKEEDEPVSPPPPQPELMIPLVAGHIVPPAQPTPTKSPPISETQRVLPLSEPRKTGTCYFCKKSFMKNKQLMNHVCPKKPRGSVSPFAKSSPS